MPKNQKQAPNISKQPSAGARPKATKENVRPRSSKTHTSLNSAKDSKTNGAKDVETGVRDEDMGALVASLRGKYLFFKSLISLYNSLLSSADQPVEEPTSSRINRRRDPPSHQNHVPSRCYGST
jgi:hypothetical protein